MEAVAAADEVASDLVRGAVLVIADLGKVRIQIVDAEVVDFEDDLAAGVQARLNQILDHLLLGVDRDGAAAGEFGHIDAVALPAEAEPDALVAQALPLQAFADPGFDHQVDRALFQHARADALFDIIDDCGSPE